jgi:hypothetical protein
LNRWIKNIARLSICPRKNPSQVQNISDEKKPLIQSIVPCTRMNHLRIINKDHTNSLWLLNARSTPGGVQQGDARVKALVILPYCRMRGKSLRCVQWLGPLVSPFQTAGFRKYALYFPGDWRRFDMCHLAPKNLWGDRVVKWLWPTLFAALWCSGIQNQRLRVIGNRFDNTGSCFCPIPT